MPDNAYYSTGIAVAFAPQSDRGVYNPVLEAITDTLRGQRVPGGADLDDGLLLGDAESGVNGSGLTLAFERDFRDKAYLAGSLTRPLSDLIGVRVSSFQFSFPWCNHRANVQGVPVDDDFRPLLAHVALLEGAGALGAAWGGGEGWSFKYSGNTIPFSALVFADGMRYQLLDCRCSLSIAYAGGEIPIATADIQPGSILDASEVALPTTLNYGEQAIVSAASVGNPGVAFTWQDVRGFTTGTLDLGAVVSEFQDSNAATGLRREFDGRTAQWTGTLYRSEDDPSHHFDQLGIEDIADTDALSFTVGTPAAASEPAKAIRVLAPNPEAAEDAIGSEGNLATGAVTLNLRSSTANEELELIFV